MKSESKISQNDALKILDTCYEKCCNGIPKISVGVEEMANEYLQKYSSKDAACKALIRNQIAKCTTSGFLTGFGGFIVMPVTLPANITSVIYVQMRMIACIAYMAGFDPNSDHTQTLVYACFAGVSISEFLKNAGIKFGVKLTNTLVKKIPGKMLTKINQKVGFRFVTKFGTKGVVNLGKLIPGIGAIISGGFDFVETKIIANRAYKWFFESDFSVSDDKEFIEIDDYEYK